MIVVLLYIKIFKDCIELGYLIGNNFGASTSPCKIVSNIVRVEILGQFNTLCSFIFNGTIAYIDRVPYFHQKLKNFFS